MTSLAADTLLTVWLRGRDRHPVDRALVLLAAAEPGQSAAELASLSVGERDERLIALWEEQFGPLVPSLADCPRCQERVEFTLAIADLRVVSPETEPVLDLDYGERRLRFRLPTSYDLAAIARCDDPDQARALLARRCLLDDDADALPEEIVAALADALAARDPQAEVLLDLACPGCGHAWQVIFDIVAFLWTEVAAEARRVLHAVDALARAYGWSEAEILALSPARRQLYLEMAG
jgi:hypothetical protein